MNEPVAELRALTAKSLETVIEELGAVSRAAKRGEAVRVPRVTLRLRSGADLRGFILDVSTDKLGAVWLLVHQPGLDGRVAESDVVYFNAGSLEAVTIHDAPSMNRAPESVGPPPSRLDLKRRLGAIEATLTEQIGKRIECQAAWDKIPETAEASTSLADLVAQTSDVVNELLQESLAREAMSTKVTRIELGVSAKAEVELNAGVLSLTTTHSWPDRLQKTTMKSQIEALL